MLNLQRNNVAFNNAKQVDMGGYNHLKYAGIKESGTYRCIGQISKWMDRYYLDAVIGLLLERVGDFITQLLTLPYLYISIFKIKSLPLTLAIIYNSLCDLAIGMIPLGIGDMMDIFKRSYMQNFKLIDGFIHGDRATISAVNKKAAITVVLIVLMVVVIYILVKLTIVLMRYVLSMLVWLL